MSQWIDDQVNQDFSKARSRAFINAISAALRQQPATLLPFEEVRARVIVRGQRDMGLQLVPIDKIVGSEGRYGDFDRLFLPRNDRSETRWKSIDRAQYKEQPIPPIELYKLGEIYFVRDGNHRVSVARQRGQEEIDAHVVELQIDFPLSPELDRDDLELTEERSDFYEWTGLARLRPGATVELTTPGGYLQLIRHINGHRYFLDLEHGDDTTSAEQAVSSWYDNVYMPLVSAIRRCDILEAFPDRSEGDLYLWIMDHRHYLTQQSGEDPGADEAVIDYAINHGPAKARRRVKRRKVSKAEREFLAWSGLDFTRPGADLHLSDPAGYQALRSHIEEHRAYLAQEQGRAAELPEAAASWYDRVFYAAVEAIRRLDALESFPQHTPADLYLLVMQHLSYLKEQGVQADAAAAAADYARQFAPEKVPLLAGLLHHTRRLLGRTLLERLIGEDE